MENVSNPLVGAWVTDPSDENSISTYGRVRLEFTQGGKLIYTIHAQGADQTILMTYRIDGDQVVTDQPSRPLEKRTRFTIRPDGKLCLLFEGVESVYAWAGKSA